MGQDENTNPFNGNETPVFETPTPTPAPEAPAAPVPTPEPTPAPEAPAPAPVAEAPVAPAPIPVTKPGQVSESVSQLSSYNRLGMRPSRNLSAREELDRIAPKAPVAPAAVAKEKGPRDPKIKIIIVLVIVTAIALVAMLVISAMSGNGGIFGGKKNSAVSTSGEANLDVIFDDKAYLPYFENGLWGYKNPENGEVVIKAKYTAAERFYGDYAAVSFVDGDTAKSAIIDKEGNVKLEQKNSESATEVRYEVEQNVWYIGDNVYDASLNQLNDDGTIGQYVGAGYVSNSKVEAKKGTTVYLTDSSKTKVYDCAALCSIFVSENGKYAEVYTSSENQKIISLPDGKGVYSTASKGRISYLSGNYFYERLKDGTEQYYLADNEFKKIDKSEYVTDNYYGYEYEKCENGAEKISRDDSVIINCDANSITTPSAVTRSLFEKNGKKIVVMKKAANTLLYDLSKKEEIKNFGSNVSYQFALNSEFLMVEKGDKATIYNILDTTKKIEFSSLNAVSIKENYFSISDGTTVKIYNKNMKEV